MERFDQPVDRRGTASIKWDRAAGKFGKEDLIPLWIADTDFQAPEPVVEALSGRVDHRVFGYSFGDAEYLDAIRGWFGRRHGLEIQPQWIVPTVSVVTALYFSILELTAPGEKVLTFTPIYDPFYAIIHNTGRELAPCPLSRGEEGYAIDFDAFEQALQGGVKLVLFCNPHNPTGRVWTAGELQALVDLCAQYDVFLVSDEIHCDFALFGNHYTSLLQFEEIHSRLIVATAAGKSFNLAGLSASHLFAPDAGLCQRIGGRLRGAWIMSPNIMGMQATKAAYRHGDAWMDAQKQYIEQNSRLVSQCFADALPLVKVSPHQGTFLLWVDFSGLGLSQEELTGRLVHRCGVGLSPGTAYDPEATGFMRMNIGCRSALLEQALARICSEFGR